MVEGWQNSTEAGEEVAHRRLAEEAEVEAVAQYPFPWLMDRSEGAGEVRWCGELDRRLWKSRACASRTMTNFAADLAACGSSDNSSDEP